MKSQRGIAPNILFQHIENTAAFIFHDVSLQAEYLEKVRHYRDHQSKKLTHLEYFELCIAAHYTTVATFVPTDVDNQIRQHLWTQPLPKEVSDAMLELTLASKSWNFRVMTERYANHPEDSSRYLSGHQGEWFSIAVGAYAKHRGSLESKRVMESILAELQEEEAIFRALMDKKMGIELLRASTLIAHNLGDLDRVMDQWDLPENDPLRLSAYKSGHEEKNFPHLVLAGNLNKAFMASENHRHYPLRAPKVLRRSRSLLLPTGPFFDTWGKQLAKELEPNELIEVIQALLEGFERLSSPKVPLYGYARALAGIDAGLNGGFRRFLPHLPGKTQKKLQEIPLKNLLPVSEAAFLDSWHKKALDFLKL